MNNIKVTLISSSPSSELNIAMAAKLCYSGKSGTELLEDETNRNPEEISKYLDMLMDMGHESPVEHTYFMFLIEGISRACSHQLVRHRVASYSQMSQRYVRKESDHVTPPEIANDMELLNMYNEIMIDTMNNYEIMSNKLMNKYLLNELIEEFPVYSEADKSDYKRYLLYLLERTNTEEKLPLLKQKMIKDALNRCEKKAIEDARYILPNACETQMVVSMNARSLLNMFKHRLCNRAQWEIREVANQIFNLVYPHAPNVFKHAFPSCVTGQCKEGKLCCGKTKEMRELYKQFIK